MSSTQVPVDPSEQARRLARGQELEAKGRLLDALDAYSSAHSTTRDPALESKLLRLRFDAFSQLDDAVPREPWPLVAPGEPWASVDTLPELTPSELTAESLSTGVGRHGGVLVRGLVAADTARRLLSGME